MTEFHVHRLISALTSKGWSNQPILLEIGNSGALSGWLRGPILRLFITPFTLGSLDTGCYPGTDDGPDPVLAAWHGETRTSVALTFDK